MPANPNRAKQPLRKNVPAKKPVAKKSLVKTPAKKPLEKKPPAKVMPPVGPLGKVLLQNLKKAAPGTPDEAVIMETLRAIPPDQLKAALNKATPKERNLLFSGIPGDQIKSLIGSLPTTVLAPSKPPAPPPSPTNGPPASILMTTYENVPYLDAQKDPLWAQKITDGHTIDHNGPLEWVSVYDPRREREGSLDNPMVGLTGWAVNPEISESDVWFVHPFDKDFEFYVVPDPQYESLLAASNTGVRPDTGEIDKDYACAMAGAKALGLDATKGVLGIETDQGLVPQSFRGLITPGTRVAVFGRWIVDCGHPDFHTEIHPPLLMAVAKPAPAPGGIQGGLRMTSVQIISRPYSVSQRFGEGNFIDHLVREVYEVEATSFLFPISTRVSAHPTVFTTSYEGRPYVKLLVQPPSGKHKGPVGNPLQNLMVSYHFTHRAGVAVQVFDAGNDTVGIIIVLGDLNPAALPTKHDLTVSWDEVRAHEDSAIWEKVLELVDLGLGNPFAAFLLNRGILTDLYDSPSASSPLDNQNVVSGVRVDQLQPGAGVSEDDVQPFPIYEWLNVWWEESVVDPTTNLPLAT